MTDPRLAALRAIIADEWPCTCSDAWADRELAAPGCPAIGHRGTDDAFLHEFLTGALEVLDDSLVLTAASPEPGVTACVIDGNGRPWRHATVDELSTHEEYTHPWRTTDGRGSTWTGLFTRDNTAVRLVEPGHD
jgi:hypothetical protein